MALIEDLDTSEWLSASETIDGPGIDESFTLAGDVSFSYRADGKAQVARFPLKGFRAARDKLFECAMPRR